MSIKDHPRACGENLPVRPVLLAFRGSPPRVRGKPERHPASKRAYRITPARAGKTAPAEASSGSPADHPRACGENPLKIVYSVVISGSPPRVRGKRLLRQTRSCAGWITPARAGKTFAASRAVAHAADHPRACGENQGKTAEPRRGIGSPPRVRGKPIRKGSIAWVVGITPARAGKTCWA